MKQNPKKDMEGLMVTNNMNKLRKEQVDDWIYDYLKFKDSCVRQEIFDIDEIIKLFELRMKG